MFKHDTMEKYVADSLAASQSTASGKPFDFFRSGDATVIPFRRPA